MWSIDDEDGDNFVVSFEYSTKSCLQTSSGATHLLLVTNIT